MNPAALSPEECYRLAKEHMAAEDFAVAAQLLQVAILKAPREATYSQALEDLRSRRLMKLKTAAKEGRPLAAEFTLPTEDQKMGQAEIDALRDIVARFPDEPEHMLRLACQLDAVEQTQEALTWARKASELQEDSLDAHLLQMILHKKLGNKSAETRARRDVKLISAGHLGDVRKARGRLRQMGLVHDPTLPLVPPAGQRFRAVLLVALLLVTTAGYYFGRPAPAVPIDAAPFLALEETALALERVETAEVILALSGHTWGDWDTKARRDHLLALYDVALELGYRRLLVQDGSGAMLGLAENDKIYLRQELEGQETSTLTQVSAPGRVERAVGESFEADPGPQREAGQGGDDAKTSEGDDPDDDDDSSPPKAKGDKLTSALNQSDEP